ncbi:hypothetical protein NQ318_018861 [Aromia moschata]|uniref:Uncharacterized protein n=1 Tax=Aromia moschata TaxID=1265417 RepID=A0AAV8ZFV4_9CUCU|nr:hypothetical protein NQ318_018861 [Aromia moschata]
MEQRVNLKFLVKLGKTFTETTEDDPRPGRPSTSNTDENVEKIGLAEITGIDKECVRWILHESFNMRKVCANMVPKLLTPEQKESRMNTCTDILNNIDTAPGLNATWSPAQAVSRAASGTERLLIYSLLNSTASAVGREGKGATAIA